MILLFIFVTKTHKRGNINIHKKQTYPEKFWKQKGKRDQKHQNTREHAKQAISRISIDQFISLSIYQSWLEKLFKFNDLRIQHKSAIYLHMQQRRNFASKITKIQYFPVPDMKKIKKVLFFQYFPVPIFFSSTFQYFQYFPVLVATLYNVAKSNTIAQKLWKL